MIASQIKILFTLHKRRFFVGDCEQLDVATMEVSIFLELEVLPADHLECV